VSLYGALREDRPLAVAVLVMTTVCVLPVFFTPLLPFLDLPNHIALAGSMGDVLLGNGVTAEHYEIKLKPNPYWGFYLLVGLCDALLPTLLAAKVAVCFTVLLIPLGTIRLLAALGRDPRLGLLAFALTWDFSAYMGFLTYRLGLGLALFFLAGLVETETVKSAIRRAWRVAVLALTHAQALGLFAVSAAALALDKGKEKQRLVVHAVYIVVGSLVLAPWFLGRAIGCSGGGGGGGGGTKVPAKLGGFATWNQGPWERVGLLHDNTVGNIPTSWGTWTSGIALVLVLVTALVLLFVKKREDAPSPRRTVAWLVLCLLLYFAAPLWIGWPITQWGVYPRHATLLVIAWLALPRPDLSGRRALLLAPALAGVLALHVAVSVQFADFGTRARGLVRLIEQMEPDSRVLGLVQNMRDPMAVHERVWNQFPAYAVALHGGYEPNIFDFRSNVVRHVAKRRLPKPGWNRASAFSRQRHGRHYDYLLVRGRVRWAVEGPIPNGGGVIELVDEDEASGWRLFRVNKE
jgi:hypothetical protein